MAPAFSRAMVSTERSIEPRCTGMCGALATRFAFASKIAQEKSSRSLMFTEDAVFWQRHAHLLGDGHEALVEHLQQHRISVSARRRRAPAGRTRAPAARDPSRSARARQPSSITMVWCGSISSAGPAIMAPGARSDSQINARLAPRPLREEAAARAGLRLRIPATAAVGSSQRLAAAERLHARGFDHKRLRRVHEAKPRAMRVFERRPQRRRDYRAAGDISSAASEPA
jgi:hypothetical protein